jgi:6-phosphogluconolactonase
MSDRADPQPRLRRFAQADEMFRTLADEIAAQLRQGIVTRGAASFVASGGTTPGALYDTLSERDLAWDRVFVTLSDERWVSPGSTDSNENLLRTRLLRGKAALAHLVPLKTPAASPSEAEADVDRAIAAMPLPFDVTLLGMGDDGHTASLFPNAEGLSEALDLSSPALVRAITPKNAAGSSQRMSLTLRAILASRLIVILIRGEEKLAAYGAAVSGDDERAMPVRAILHRATAPVETFWAP